ncbi:NAD(+) synthase [Salinarimonas sp.]|uniref:NAD(+) synthase n=1 Tax=Salinarimonas sp. TaxID=2766526 RepID=UPI0032D994A5
MRPDSYAVPPFTRDALALDPAYEIARIAGSLTGQVRRRLKKRGIVLGLSGGIDSSVTAGLAVAALGADRVLGVLMPERDSDPESLRLGRLVAERFGIETVVEDIAPMLDAAGCYARRDAAIREIVPAFGPGWGCKVVLDPDFRARGYNLSSLVVRSPEGVESRHRLPLAPYQAIIAAANMKQRTRKQLEYYHADRLNYAVAGTPNRLEYELGFFVKNGDGAADVKPIAHLYKTQVYQLAAYLGVPDEIRSRPPTTDTWSMPQSQEEFYFAADTATMDLCLYALDARVPAEQVAAAAQITVAQVEAVWRDIAGKRKVASVLLAPPITVEPLVRT